MFQRKLSSACKVDFMGQVAWFLGIHFQWTVTPTNVSAHLSQQAYVETIVELFGLTCPEAITGKPALRPPPKSQPTPFTTRPIDTFAQPDIPNPVHVKRMQEIVGCMQWIAQSTRVDIATVVNLLAQYQSNPSIGHLRAAYRVLRYLSQSSNWGISYSSDGSDNLTSFIKFPFINNQPTAMCDANWGPQDQSRPNPNSPQEIPIHTARSISGYIIYLAGGPISWSSKRQTITARSSAESEIYATDECCKHLLYLRKTFTHHGLHHFSQPIDLYNDNMACVLWSKATTTKGLRHITIRENATRESVIDKTIDIHHIGGKINPSDLLTKEFGKDPAHFQALRGANMTQTPTHHPLLYTTPIPTAAAAARADHLNMQPSGHYNSYPSSPPGPCTNSISHSLSSLCHTLSYFYPSCLTNYNRTFFGRLGGVT